MISWDLAWKRAVEAGHPFVRGKKKSDFRPIAYNQEFANIAIGATTGNLLQQFSAGAFVLGIEASATFARIVKPDQYYADGSAAPLDSTFDRLPSATPGNQDLFSIDMSYTQDEVITPGGPVLAYNLLGRGNFPVREIIVDTAQGILCRVRSEVAVLLVSGAAAAAGIQLPIDVHVTYHAMVPRAVG